MAALFTFMRKVFLFALLIVALGACSTARNAPAGVGRPDVRITQISAMPPAARHTSGGMPVRFNVRVRNNGTTPLMLERVVISSVGAGAYEVGHTAEVDVTIEPQQTGAAEFWAPTQISESVVGANGPVTLRVVATFKTPEGSFEDVTVQNVSANGTVR